MLCIDSTWSTSQHYGYRSLGSLPADESQTATEILSCSPSATETPQLRQCRGHVTLRFQHRAADQPQNSRFSAISSSYAVKPFFASSSSSHCWATHFTSSVLWEPTIVEVVTSDGTSPGFALMYMSDVSE